jgi:hypothetical protein
MSAEPWLDLVERADYIRSHTARLRCVRDALKKELGRTMVESRRLVRELRQPRR